MSLTKQQNKVVQAEGNCSCIALPGSGKSYTCVHHIVTRLDTIPNCKYQAISFTRKAADELRGRVISEIGIERYNKQVNVSTFDSLFIKQLQQANGGKRIKIMSNAEKHNLILRTLNHLDLTKKLKVQDAKSAVDSFAGYAEIPHSKAMEKPAEFKVFQQFETFRKAKRMWDFPSIAKAVVKGQDTGLIPLLDVTHLQVDEFQDVNTIQYSWLKKYRESTTQVLVVGDDDQGIYQFRGSNGYGNFINFREDFSPEVHILDTCFRCKPGILHAAETLINNNNPDRVNKKMRSIHEKGGLVAMISASSGDTELDDVVAGLEGEANHGDWAVLSRTNLRLWHLAAKLTAKDIPFQTKQTESIFATPLSDIYYKIVKSSLNENKIHGPDILSWLGCSEEDIIESQKRGGLSRRFSMANYRLDNKDLPTTIDEKLFVTWTELISGGYPLNKGIALIKTLMIENRGLSKGEVRMFDIVSKIITSTNEPTFKGGMKIFCKMVENSNKPKANKDEPENKGIELLTLHSSKGQQWKNVWIIGCTAGQIPSEPKDPEEKNEAEERRLLFVGMTRAMDKLYMSYKSGEKSIFIEEIEPYLESEEYRKTIIYTDRDDDSCN